MLKQIAVYLENKKGKAAECCKIIKDQDINIEAMSIADTQDFGILRLITSNNEKALAALKANNFIANIVELVGVEIPNQPGALAILLKELDEDNINIEYLYSFANDNGQAQIGFKTDDIEKAAALLKSRGVKTI
ncbi:MAG: amino acid-binding protein [Clostridia bacterium]|nr:amino acid-binding protein [Clostridia bacterium]MBP5593703.1 amino acid-binding protein [Clostridia bacterium]MBP5648786.1 amino acid-binding protein [Clostridia bacterium]